jgi:hypothetical protein
MKQQATSPPKPLFMNPFRPGAGHTPPYLAGRTAEQDALRGLLQQTVVTQNMILTGLRGSGKTVLLDTFKPISNQAGWLWVGTDLSESASLSEERMATRILTDVALITSSIVVAETPTKQIGFAGSSAPPTQHSLTYEVLHSTYDSTPGLASDKLKATLELVWHVLSEGEGVSGIVFAYDEAQNLADHADRHEYPLSLLLEVFQSLQRRGIPFMLVLTGLPTLASKLVDARTYTERMFHVVFLKPLDEGARREAIVKPTLIPECRLRFSAPVVERISHMSGGYPYFIQFICKEVLDIWISKIQNGEIPSVPEAGIIHKLDSDFFEHRWIKASDRQRELLQVIATLETAEAEFTVQEIVSSSKEGQIKGFSPSHVNQMLASLANAGLVYKNRHGKYSLAVPLLAQFILRQTTQGFRLTR